MRIGCRSAEKCFWFLPTKNEFEEAQSGLPWCCRFQKKRIRCNDPADEWACWCFLEIWNTFFSPPLFDLSDDGSQLGNAEHGIDGLATIGRKKGLEGK